MEGTWSLDLWEHGYTCDQGPTVKGLVRQVLSIGPYGGHPHDQENRKSGATPYISPKVGFSTIL
jgi:hypothetical protein